MRAPPARIRPRLAGVTFPAFPLAATLFVLSGCGSALPGGTTTVDPAVAGEPVVVRGAVTYDSREPTRTGASRALGRRPARFVRVELLRRGQVVASGATDERGAFALEGPGADTVRVVAAIDHDGHRLAVGPDPIGRVPGTMQRRLEGDVTDLDVVASDLDEGGPAGAFHILDTMLRGSLAVRAWTGERLPPAYAYWVRGGTTDWSYYRGQRASGAYVIELLGGEMGRQDSTDTDEHDEEIVLHEFGHFVMDVLTSDSSSGGTHPSGYLIDPGLAWEEGRASWFAAAVQGRSLYRDTIGLEPRGELRVDLDLEARGQGPRGIGSEEGVSELLWDLADGAGGLPDRDGDGVAIGPAALFGAMRELGREPGAFPCIATFLQFVVDRGLVSSPDMKRVVERGGHPAAVFPDGGPSPWPVEVALGRSVSGKVDSVTSPAPSGGPPRPGNGVDAVRTYRVHVPEGGFLEAELTIFGSGRGADRQDLDLELRDIRAELLDGSAGEGTRERVARAVPPGWYVLYVRGGGAGNQAGYELTVRVH